MNDLDTIYERSQCLVTAFITYREEVLNNTSPYDIQSKSEILNCLTLEQNYTNIKRQVASHFKHI